MHDSAAFPWGPGLALLIAGVCVLGVVLAVVKIAEWLYSLRDELRDRYSTNRWVPSAADFFAIPLWLTLELLCLAGAIVFAVLTIWLAYETAKGFRDWWHAGERSRRCR